MAQDANLFTFSPASLKASVAGIELDGFSDGVFIELEPSAPASVYVPGVDGSGTRIKGIDISWKCTLRIQQEHRDATRMQILQAYTRSLQTSVTTLDIFPMWIYRADTRTKWLTGEAYVEEFATETFGTDESSQVREFVFRWRDIKFIPGELSRAVLGAIPSISF
jgi:hypothetical protein